MALKLFRVDVAFTYYAYVEDKYDARTLQPDAFDDAAIEDVTKVSIVTDVEQIDDPLDWYTYSLTDEDITIGEALERTRHDRI